MQAPLPLSELGSSRPTSSALFIPFLRDALFQVFVDRTAEAKPNQRNTLFRPVAQLHESAGLQADAYTFQSPADRSSEGSQRARVAMVLKVMGGRLLLQLHSRAARRQDVHDSWFHAPNLARYQFRRGMLRLCQTAIGSCATCSLTRMAATEHTDWRYWHTESTVHEVWKVSNTLLKVGVAEQGSMFTRR
jgi:hypothetical protein